MFCSSACRSWHRRRLRRMRAKTEDVQAARTANCPECGASWTVGGGTSLLGSVLLSPLPQAGMAPTAQGKGRGARPLVTPSRNRSTRRGVRSGRRQAAGGRRAPGSLAGGGTTRSGRGLTRTCVRVGGASAVGRGDVMRAAGTGPGSPARSPSVPRGRPRTYEAGETAPSSPACTHPLPARRSPHLRVTPSSPAKGGSSLGPTARGTTRTV